MIQTLNTVKKYFKNAKLVKGNVSIYEGIIEDISNKKIYYYSDEENIANGYYIDCEGGDFLLYNEETNKFAEIISYKN